MIVNFICENMDHIGKFGFYYVGKNVIRKIEWAFECVREKL